jgi:hypothetical protein
VRHGQRDGHRYQAQQRQIVSPIFIYSKRNSHFVLAVKNAKKMCAASRETLIFHSSLSFVAHVPLIIFPPSLSFSPVFSS